MSNKEVKTKPEVNRDPSFERFDANEFSFANRLQLDSKIKKDLADKGLDYRFLNAAEFRANGGTHHSHWKPYKPDPKLEALVNAEGIIARGDLILGVRPKKVTQAHRAFLAEKNGRYLGYSKEKAAEMRKDAARAGVSDQVKIHEGYEDDKGSKRGSYSAAETITDED